MGLFKKDFSGFDRRTAKGKGLGTAVDLVTVGIASLPAPLPVGFQSTTTFTWSDGYNGANKGAKYVGGWKNGKFNGQGTFTIPDGDKYVGEFKNGKENGQETYTWSDGRKYVGEYKDGKIDGKGTQTFSDGGKWTGEFRKNKRWNTTIYNKNGNIIGKFVNGTEYDKYGNFQGKWVNGVQR